MEKITEDYVSYETAKLLVKKGLKYNDAEYESYYTIHGIVIYFKDRPTDINIAPRFTIQTAIKWLMKKHNICIVSMPVVTDDEGEAGCLWNYIISRKLEVLHNSECLYESSEIALNDAIKYCLEYLI